MGHLCVVNWKFWNMKFDVLIIFHFNERLWNRKPTKLTKCQKQVNSSHSHLKYDDTRWVISKHFQWKKNKKIAHFIIHRNITSNWTETNNTSEKYLFWVNRIWERNLRLSILIFYDFCQVCGRNKFIKYAKHSLRLFHLFTVFFRLLQGIYCHSF